MAGLGTMITPASPEWVLLNAVYHHVLAQRASPEAAQIEIATAHQNGQLRWRCTLREYKALPKLRLSRGEHPPQLAPTVTAHYPIRPDTRFDTFDWEHSRAFSPNDPVIRSVYEYLDITAHRDDVLALWPVGAPSEAAETEAETMRRTIALAIIDGQPKGRRTKTADLKRSVADNWNEECARFRVDPKKVLAPSRDTINRYLGRRKN
jgi:hypothetical protein